MTIDLDNVICHFLLKVNFKKSINVELKILIKILTKMRFINIKSVVKMSPLVVIKVNAISGCQHLIKFIQNKKNLNACLNRVLN